MEGEKAFDWETVAGSDQNGYVSSNKQGKNDQEKRIFNEGHSVQSANASMAVHSSRLG